MEIIELLSEALGLEKNDLINFSHSAPYRYKVYEIPKKKEGKKRIIAQPSKELKFIQRGLIDILKNKLIINNSAFAYQEGLSIKHNALEHINSKYLLKMDFENFFQSIRPQFLFLEMNRQHLKISAIEKEFLREILFWKEKKSKNLRLSVGAPSSPLISNFVMNYFDEIVKENCELKDIKYTRYADDITFSTSIKNNLFAIPELVSNILKITTSNFVKINDKKTVFSSKAFNRHVTGITLTNNNGISVGRIRKRIISSMIHKFSLGVLSASDTIRLEGLLSFVSSIEPCFYEKMEKKYSVDVMKKIKNINAIYISNKKNSD